MKVHPTPGEWCGCDGKAFGGTMPTSPWRFTGKCQATLGLVYSPADQGLALVGSDDRLELGRYRSCVTAPPAKDTLTGARCQGWDGATVEIRVTRDGGRVAALKGKSELGQSPAAEGQKLTMTPFKILQPDPPRPFLVRFDDLADSRRDSSLTGKRKLIFNADGGAYSVGLFTSCKPLTKPGAETLPKVECADGATRHVLSATLRAQTVILVDRVGDAAPVESVRVAVPAGRQVMGEGTHTY